MAQAPRQGRDTNVSLGGEFPTLSFGQMMDLLTKLYQARGGEISRLTGRVKKVQRCGIPFGSNVGKGPRARYSLDSLFQVIVVLELAELSISLTNASELVAAYWPETPTGLAPAHAWLGHVRGDEDAVLLMANASEVAGFAAYSSFEDAARARSAAFMAGTRFRPFDGLTETSLSRIINNGRLDLSRTTLGGQLWRTSIVDCSTLVPAVVKLLVQAEIISHEQMTAWSIHQCDEFAAKM